MAHINPRLDPRRAKMLDLGNKSVKGGANRRRRHSQKVAKQNYHQWARRCEDRTYRHLRDFHCSGDAECDCPGCSCELWTAGRIFTRWHWDWHWDSLDDLGGAYRSAEKWALRLGSSDAFLSWLKRNYPDTVAGRHAVDHIMESLDWVIGCNCEELKNASGKGNHGQCTCGAFRAKVNLCRADLSREDLSGEDLSNMDLSEADLSEANLSGVPLYGANLYGANLAGANLAGANLREANIYRANLEGANLSGADLREARITRADLRGANLHMANLYMANLERADLSGARSDEDATWPEGFDPVAAGVTFES